MTTGLGNNRSQFTRGKAAILCAKQQSQFAQAAEMSQLAVTYPMEIVLLVSNLIVSSGGIADAPQKKMAA